MRILKTFFILSFLLCSNNSISAPAGNPEVAKSFVQNLSDKTLGLIQSGKFDTETSAVNTFASLFDSSFHLPYMVGFVLGRAGRGQPRPLIERFSNAFRRKIINSYATRFKDYKGATSKIINVSAAGKNFKVKSKIVSNKEYNVVWTVRFYNGQPKIIAVAVEGVDLAYSYKNQYQQIISQKGLEGLLSQIGG